MQRRVRPEDIEQQVGREQRVHGDALGGVLAERRRPLDDQQRPKASFGQLLRGAGNHLSQAGIWRDNGGARDQQPSPAQLFQGAADLGLKQHGNGKNQCRNRIAQQKLQHGQVEDIAEHKAEGEQDQDAAHQCRG